MIENSSGSTSQKVTSSEYEASEDSAGSYTQRSPAAFVTLISSVSIVFAVNAAVTNPLLVATESSPYTGRPQASWRVTRMTRPRTRVRGLVGMGYSSSFLVVDA